MKKKLLAIITLAVMTFSLCSCSSSPTPTETVDAFLTAIKTQDSEGMKAVYPDGDLNEMYDAAEFEEGIDELGPLLLEKLLAFDYEITEEKIDGEKATVTVDITTYALGTAFTDFMSEYMTQAFALAFSDASDEEIEALATTLFENEINKLTEKNYTDTVDIALSQTDDGWVIDEIEEDDDFYNALTGGIIDAVESINEAFSSEEE